MADIDGDENDNIIIGTFQNDNIRGFGGDDQLFGGSGNDFLDGGTGNDFLAGGSGVNTLFGGTGADIFASDVRGSQTNTIQDYVDGVDKLDFSFWNVADIATFAPYIRQVGFDVVIQAFFGSQNEIFTIEDVNLSDLTDSDFIFNTNTTDLTVSGSSFQSNVLFGGLGNDTLLGGSNTDELNGGSGNDFLNGGRGTNLLRGNSGSDSFALVVRGTQDGTVVDFVDGTDRIDVSGWNIADFETLMPYIRQVAFDVVIDTFFSAQDELLTIEDISLGNLTASDFVFNTNTTDLTVTGSGFQSNVLFGGLGDDTLIGGSSTDELNGGAGNDLLNGGRGTNLLRGNSGNDQFALVSRGTQNSTVIDFVDGTDRINVIDWLIGDLDTLMPYIRQDGSDVVIETFFSGQNEVFRIENISLANLTASDFFFNQDPLDLTISGSSFQSNVLFGSLGDDTLIGGSSTDELNGGAGNDLLDGGRGTNLLRGNSGNDQFALVSRGTQNSTVVDYVDGTDRINVIDWLVGDLATLMPYIRQDGNDVVIETFFSGGDEVFRIQNLSLADLTASDFFFNQDPIDRIVSGSSFQRNVLFSSGGDDTLNGGSSIDELNGGAGDDELNGNNGNDLLRGGTGTDVLDGGSGIDTAAYDNAGGRVVVMLDADTGTIGDAAGDTLVNIENLLGSDFNDFLSGDANNNTLSGGGGNDRLLGRDGDDAVNGGDGDDDMFGGLGDDTLNGDAGDDFMNGQGGDDTLNGGDGVDTIFGASGNDVVNGGAGNDSINGNGGDDTIDGGTGSDDLNGAVGFDVINGGDGADIISGGNQNDTLSGDAGNDIVNGDAGNDVVNGGTGNDTLIGASGADILNGDAGNDNLSGNSGGDDLFGGDGDDILNGGGGNDDLNGGAGADTFVANLGFRTDRIQDFEDGIDQIDFSGNSLANDFAQVLASATQFGTNVRIDLNANNALIIEGFNLADLDATDFIF